MSDQPWKSDDWFSSAWNFNDEVTKDLNFAETIKIHDVTLRDGEQQTGVAFTFDDKLRIAEGLAATNIKSELAELETEKTELQDITHGSSPPRKLSAGCRCR